ncbi:hypothetical protein Shyd_18260 [Streptomyces hydrogenans]|uniref:Uncharacterized protein n=1 Tax=Streptomyces hydrogenans TaxID=1873719 RepID=A0ABQ3P629_9ACTN|nr:hypothetical protein [Streptomyces hydrogenans]GHI20455.1 hypothetical protein Shyd_18260 [Streptomyces hydrogenans]
MFADQVLREGGEVDRFADRGDGAVRGEQEQVVGQVLEADDVGRRLRDDLAPVRDRVGVSQG